MPKVIGDRPRPWAFVVGPDEDSPGGQAVVNLFPTVRFVTTTTGLHQFDFDAAIAVGAQPHDDFTLDDHLCVIQFGGLPAVNDWHVRHKINSGSVRITSYRVGIVPGVRSHQFTAREVADQDQLLGLVESSVIPEPGSEYHALTWLNSHQRPGPPTEAAIVPFAEDSAGHVLAGRMLRGPAQGSGELWYLPASAWAAADDWVAAAVRHWTRTRPERFPSAATWHEDPEWMTHAEHIAQRALDEQLQRMKAVASDLMREAQQLNAERDAAQKAAADGARLLLTSQSDELVSQVAEALRRLGFEVLDADGLPANASGKQEDLQITADDGWLCLAEVKGYSTRNAKASDLSQLNKAVEIYGRRENRWPDARWYVVNQSFETPPSQRSEPLKGSDELPIFAEIGGLVIDTRDLFRLVRDTESAVLEAHQARALLQKATGVFRYPTNR